MHHQPPRSLRCFAHGRDHEWEGICVDLDIAVQGSSFDEVKNLLEDAVRGYIEAVMDERPDVQKQLLSRRAPFGVVAKLWIKSAMFNLFDGRQREEQASFPLACPV